MVNRMPDAGLWLTGHRPTRGWTYAFSRMGRNTRRGFRDRETRAHERRPGRVSPRLDAVVFGNSLIYVLGVQSTRLKLDDEPGMARNPLKRHAPRHGAAVRDRRRWHIPAHSTERIRRTPKVTNFYAIARSTKHRSSSRRAHRWVGHDSVAAV